MAVKGFTMDGVMLTEMREGHNPYTSTPVFLQYQGQQLHIDFSEDGKYSDDSPQGITIEVDEGALRVRVWADSKSESEDPTHTIVIEKAKVKEGNND